MLFFRVIAAKNNQRVELIVKYLSEEAARENLHIQGYSIIEIQETEPPVQTNEEVFYFDVLINGQPKSGKIQSNDIFKAYRKLVDDLKYEVIRIYTSPDSSDEEKTYITAKTKESYLEFLKSTSGEKKVELRWTQLSRDESNTIGFLEKEVQKYQNTILLITQKLENFISLRSAYFWEERIQKIRDALVLLKQTKQITNINKLKTIGEAALVKVGELEVELSQKSREIRRSEFTSETNRLLKELGSEKRFWGVEIEGAKQKLFQLFRDFRDSIIENKEKDKKTDTNSFLYFKNVRELFIYQKKLKEIKKEIWKSIFSDATKKKRLILKKKLLEQNVYIIESRVENRKFSYSKISRGLKFYEEICVYAIRSLGDLGIYLLGFAVTALTIYSAIVPRLVPRLSQIAFIASCIAIFSILLYKTRNTVHFFFWIVIFLLVTFALQINF